MILLFKKIYYALKYKNFFFRAKIFLNSQYQKKIILVFDYINKRKHFKKLDYLSGFKKKEENRNNQKFLDKIINYYHNNFKKIKKIDGIWQENLQLKFNELIEALLIKNKSKLNKIFNNMFRLPITEGLCVGYEHFRNSQNIFGKIYIKTQFNNYLNELKKNKVNLNMIKFENIGNPSGVKFKKNIISIETLRHANQAFTINELTLNIKEPKILEIGGGLGGTCYQYIYSFNKKKIQYYLIDILEILLLCGYFLQKKRSLTFLDNNTKKKLNKKRIFLVPKDNLYLLKNIKFDLIFNSCSLSEMDIKNCNYYEKFINSHTKKNSIFYHINHDLEISYKEKNNLSINKLGSEIMSEYTNFKLIKKYKRRNNLPEDKMINYNEFIYKKI